MDVKLETKPLLPAFLSGHVSPGCPTHTGEELPYFMQNRAKEKLPEVAPLIQSFLRQPRASARANKSQ